MSRVGKKFIIIPQNVNINYSKSKIVIKGYFGTFEQILPRNIRIQYRFNILKIYITENTKYLRSLHGLYRTKIYNMIQGVSKLFCITLILKGVGYRAIIQNQKINLILGYSHPIQIEIPENINININQNTIITLTSIDKEKLGSFASTIRAWRYPEPYKGKGILYKDEKIILKTGKTGK